MERFEDPRENRASIIVDVAVLWLTTAWLQLVAHDLVGRASGVFTELVRGLRRPDEVLLVGELAVKLQ